MAPWLRRHLDILRPALRRLTAMLLRAEALLRRAEATTEVGGGTFWGGQRVTGGVGWVGFCELDVPLQGQSGGDPQVDWLVKWVGWIGCYVMFLEMEDEKKKTNWSCKLVDSGEP